MSLSKKYWGKNCAGYIQLLSDPDSYPSPYNLIMIPTLIKLVKLYSKPNHKIIDIGCGEGYFTRKIKNIRKNIVGTDLSAEMILTAKNKNPNIDYEISDIEKKIYKTEKFNLVVSTLVFHYLQKIDKALQNIFQLLDDNGYFIVTIPHPCYYHQENFNWFQDETDTQYFVGNYFHEQTTIRNIANKFTTHHIHRTIGTYTRIFVRNNFNIVDILEPKSNYNKPITLKKFTKIPIYAIFVLQKN